MKRLFLLLILAAGVGTAFAQAPVDVTKAKANTDTKVFSDGKTTVADYINAVLKSQTNCCGQDDIYLEVKVNAQGFVSSARAMSGKNECMKRSAAEIVKYVRWDLEGKTVTKPIYFPVKVNLACKGKNDNVYAAIAKPVGWNFGDAVFAEDGGSAGGSQAGTTQGNTFSEPANPNLVVEDPALKEVVLPTNLPSPVFKKGIDQKPDPSHNKSHLNTQGPAMAAPAYRGTETEMMIYLKSNLRKRQICGLAHVLAELTVDGAGDVKGVRVMQVNNDQVHQAVLPVLAGMKFNPSGARYSTYFITEFKTDIDCPNRQQVNLQQVGTYFIAPERGPKY